MALIFESDSIVAQFHRATVRFSPNVLKVFDAYRQKNSLDHEAGGQLFATIAGDAWHVGEATGPKPADRRGRFHFWPDPKSAQKEIDQYFATGLEYVGDWHTHPEKVPTPSDADILSIKNIVRESTFYNAGLLLCIVGLELFPSGLHVSFHADPE